MDRAATRIHPTRTVMIHMSPAATMQRASPPASATCSFVALLGDRGRLRAALLDKRATIARPETAWVAAAEADAAAGRGRIVRMDDRETWDHATWNRYLAAAARPEPNYMPRIRRLLGGIANIEKLLALPSGQAAHAA
jgi:hypothetical protein